MPPKKRGRSAKSSAKSGPPAKIKREDSENTKLRKTIAKIKSSDSKKNKSYTADMCFIDMYPEATIHEDYSCMLNQTNIGKNNNKFYMIQVGKVDEGYACFTKWGRVGELGMSNSEPCDFADEAIKMFEKKFNDKTKNKWSDREKFTPKSGKYTLIEMDEDSDDEEDTIDGQGLMTIENSAHKCTLDIRTQIFIKLIFYEDMFENQMSSMNLNVKKMPLGKLSKSQIAKGLEVLMDLDNAIKNKKGGYDELTSKFYTVIPHSFGRTVPPVISTTDVVNAKKEMMMTLSDIELTQSLQKSQKSQSSKDTIHPVDAQYKMLNASLELLDKKSAEFKLLVNYAKACKETRKGPILDAWRVDRDGEGDRFKLHDDIKYRKLLWHGTNVAVVAAILKAGLRIMPHSGGCVGRGIYFASEHAKSSWYVSEHFGTFEGEKNIGFMFLVEVALGNMKFISKVDGSLKKAPPGYDSIVARGTDEPDPKKNIIKKFDGKDVEIPVGPPVHQKDWKNSDFDKSEYLIYKESQARIRYILKFSFTD